MRAILLLSFLLIIAKDVRAQAVTSFASVPWGSKLPAINLEWGDPTQIVPGSGSSVLVYQTVRVEGEEVIMTFVVSDRYGLVKGGYARPYDKKSEAQRALEKYENAIDEKYPNLTKYRCSKGKEPCASRLSERFDEAVLWDDRDNATIYCIRHESEFQGQRFPEMICHFESRLFYEHRAHQEDRHF